jgi:hypothetical protein
MPTPYTTGMDPNGVEGSTRELPLYFALRTRVPYMCKQDEDTKAQIIELLLKVNHLVRKRTSDH